MAPNIVNALIEPNSAVSYYLLQHIDGYVGRFFFFQVLQIVGGWCRYGIANIPTKNNHKGKNWVNTLATTKCPSVKLRRLKNFLATKPSMPLKHGPFLCPAETTFLLSSFCGTKNFSSMLT